MIDRVLAKNPKFEIIFDFIGEDKWKGDIPSNLLGEYYIDLYAYDKAGNVAYMSKALFTVDVNNICIHLIKNDYDVSISFADDFECKVKEVLKCNAAV